MKSALVLADILTNPIIEFQGSSFRLKQAEALADAGLRVVAVSPFGRHFGSPLHDFVLNLLPSTKRIKGVLCLFPPNLRAPFLGSMVSFLVALPFLLVLRMFYGADLIYTTSVQHGAIGALVKPFYGARLIVNYGDPEFERVRGAKGWFLSMAEALAVNPGTTDGLIYLDPGITRHLKGRLRQIQTSFLPPAAYERDTPFGGAESAELQNMKRRLGLDGRFVATYTGQVSDVPYRLDILPEAARLLEKRHVRFKFLIVGTGTFLRELMERVSGEGLSDLFAFTGSVSPSEIPSYLALSDVGIQLLDDMCMGTKVITYMSNGIPVISTGRWYDQYNQCNQGESLLRNGLNCVLVPPDPLSLADAIAGLTRNPDATQAMAGEALAAVKMYTWSYHADTILRTAAGRDSGVASGRS